MGFLFLQYRDMGTAVAFFVLTHLLPDVVMSMALLALLYGVVAELTRKHEQIDGAQPLIDVGQNNDGDVVKVPRQYEL